MRGLILLPAFRNRFMNLAKRTPQQVAMTNEMRPNAKILMERPLRKTSACVEAPTVSPIRVVTTSMRGPLAVCARRLVTPDSLSRFPKKSIPSRGSPEGTMNAVHRNPTIGNMIFSFLLTLRGAFILISLSFLVVSASIIGFWITGTIAMYE